MSDLIWTTDKPRAHEEGRMSRYDDAYKQGLEDWHRCQQRYEYINVMERELATLKAENAKLQAWYDKTFGLPAEEIRHAEQVEKLEADLTQARNHIAASQHAYNLLNEEYEKVTKERDKWKTAAQQFDYEALRQREARLREALGMLRDFQNGCPLPKYEAGWTEAMRLTDAALSEETQP